MSAISFNDSISSSGDLEVRHVTASGNISSSGFITSPHSRTSKLFVDGAKGVGSLEVGSTFSVGEAAEINGTLGISGHITASSTNRIVTGKQII